MINCTPKLGGQFELESGGQFAPKLVVNLHWNRVVNLTGFSNIIVKVFVACLKTIKQVKAVSDYEKWFQIIVVLL
ncbi:MAG TPA: hypothetical protein VIH09_08920, partial [Flavobacterium sp.]